MSQSQRQKQKEEIYEATWSGLQKTNGVCISCFYCLREGKYLSCLKGEDASWDSSKKIAGQIEKQNALYKRVGKIYV